MKTGWGFVAATSVFVLSLGVSTADAQKLYWINGPSEIRRANLDGSGSEVVTTELSGGIAIALDAPGGKVYWTDASTDKIQRANLDGTDAEDLVGEVESFGIALDLVAGRIYWTARLDHKIQRANLDGSGVEDLIALGSSSPTAIALDVVGRKMYWIDVDLGTDVSTIHRSGLDGTGIEDLVAIDEIQLEASAIGLDIPAGKMYWTVADLAWGEQPGRIQRSSLDGSGVENLVEGGRPAAISLDLRTGNMYWSETGAIRRASLSGSDVHVVIEPLNPRGLAIELGPGPVPTVSEWGMVAMTLLLLTSGVVVLRQQPGSPPKK